MQANLSIVHVVSAGSHSFHWSSSKVTRELEDMARKEIERLEMTTGRKNVSVCIQEGDIAQKVCSFAQSVGADLLVIGRGVEDGATGRLRMNAYAIIREAHSPVLSI
jgi:nucleotide-binding universal stress UspA family protein